jgi:glucokinase
MSRAPLVGSIVGLDIGGSKTAVVEIDATTAATRHRIEFATEANLPFAARLPVLTAAIDQICSIATNNGRRPLALGVSIGGPLRIDAGVLLEPPHLPGWHHVPLKATLQRHYPNLPVHIEHDGNAGALAEFRFGVGRDRHDIHDLIFLTAGTGLGGGIIVNGALLRGASDTAGEFGFLQLSGSGASAESPRATWDYLASGKGLVRHAQAMHPDRWPADATVRDVVEAALADDALALAAVERTGGWLGRGLALVVTALNPQIVVVGTLGVVLGDRLLGPARRALAAYGLPQAVEACQLLPAALGTHVGDVAAAMPAIEALTRETNDEPVAIAMRA